MNDLNLISQKIIGCAFNVSNTLGAGFLEKVYQNALMIELSDNGLYAEKEKPITKGRDEFFIFCVKTGFLFIITFKKFLAKK